MISPARLDRWIHHFDGTRCDSNDPCHGAPTYKSTWTGRTKKFNLFLCIAIDLVSVLLSDIVFALHGWEESTGARAEVAVGTWAGKTLIREELKWEEL